MHALSDIYIRETLADSPLIYDRGKQTWKNGSYFLSQKDLDQREFTYQFDGTFGTYTTHIQVRDTHVQTRCSCPYPGKGCRHAVAAALHARALLVAPRVQEELFAPDRDPYLTAEEIREQALEDRKKRAATDQLQAVRGDMFTGDHKVISKDARTYTVCLHDPAGALGHCSCPDYQTNGLGTCKHILFMADYLQKEPGFKAQAATETLPFADIFWDSLAQAPRLRAPRLDREMADLLPVLGKYFDKNGTYTAADLSLVMGLMLRLHGDRRVRIRENLLKRVDHRQQVLQLEKMKGRPLPRIPLIRPLYPFQEEGVTFGVLKTGVLLGDEMGLGKTVQAIGLSLVKKELFGFEKILVITLASLRDQWLREIQRTSREEACIIQGAPSRRKTLYREKSAFKITHYDTVLRDVGVISAWHPDIIILDEAQRIRNISTRTAETVKRLPKKHAIVLTGTPVENQPEDLYSIVQFLDPYLFTPLWRFAADHFKIPRGQKVRDRQTRVAGYKNLDLLREKLSGILLRRSWEEVEDQLPEQVVNNYYVDLAPEQEAVHRDCAGELGELIRKRPLAPMDLRSVQTQILRMRMVCNSTFLVDRETQVSPKLRELVTIIDEVVAQNRRKTVIISEWTAMTYLIARHLSEAEIPFVQVSGKMAPDKRRALAETFSRDPAGLVFLTTDAGSAGLDLSVALCLINVELPWPPAQMERRMDGIRPRSHAEGDQDPPTCHIINLMARQSIEERVLAGLKQDPDLFAGLFDSDPDHMETLCRDTQCLTDQLTAFLGPALMPAPGAVPEEIPDETAGIFFPEAMEFGELDFGDPDFENPAPEDREPGKPPEGEADKPPPPGPDPARMEAVLNTGLDFMAGLVELASGRPVPGIRDRQVRMDPETGRVILSFRLPKDPS